MDYEKIEAEWETDSNIDPTRIIDELKNSHRLQHKYITIQAREKFLIRKYQDDMKELTLRKYELFTQGPSSPEERENFPSKGIILKTELPYYMGADKEIRALNLKIEGQQIKLEYLKEIISSINQRGRDLYTVIETRKFENGK